MIRKIFAVASLVAATLPSLAQAKGEREFRGSVAENTEYCTRDVTDVRSVGKLGPKATEVGKSCSTVSEGRSMQEIAESGIGGKEHFSKNSRSDSDVSGRSGSMKAFH